MRLVLDTNIVLSSIFWDGGPRRLVENSFATGVLFFCTQPLVDELADVLSRSKFRSKLSLALVSLDKVVSDYIDLVTPVVPLAVPRIAPDPNDDIVIGTALAAEADFIGTGDRTLLSLARYQDIRIITVAEALQMLV